MRTSRKIAETQRVDPVFTGLSYYLTQRTNWKNATLYAFKYCVPSAGFQKYSLGV